MLRRLLFLGYGLHDWNLLVILSHLGALPAKYTPWAIQLHPRTIDHPRWEHYGIDNFDLDIAQFLAALETAMEPEP